MFSIFTQQQNIVAVFEQYSVTEALKVKFNIQSAIKSLNIPSTELLTKMKLEGLSITDFDSPKSTSNHRIESSASIIRTHLYKMFLDKYKLTQALSDFSMSESIEIRQVLTDAMFALKLPSDELIEQMESEGLSLQKMGINACEHSRVSSLKVAKTKKRLATAIQNNQCVASEKQQQIKAKLNGLLKKEKPQTTELKKDNIAISDATNKVMAIDKQVKKISLQEALERSLQTDLTACVNY